MYVGQRQFSMDIRKLIRPEVHRRSVVTSERRQGNGIFHQHCKRPVPLVVLRARHAAVAVPYGDRGMLPHAVFLLPRGSDHAGDLLELVLHRLEHLLDHPPEPRAWSRTAARQEQQLYVDLGLRLRIDESDLSKGRIEDFDCSNLNDLCSRN